MAEAKANFTFDYEIMIDTREKSKTIQETFTSQGIPFKKTKLTTGDFQIKVTHIKCKKLKIDEDVNFNINVTIERKGSLDELTGNLMEPKKDGSNRFYKELERGKKFTKFYIVIEEPKWYSKLLHGKYRTNVDAKSMRGILLSLEAKYPNLNISGVGKEYAASYIHYLLYYHAREYVKDYIEAINHADELLE